MGLWGQFGKEEEFITQLPKGGQIAQDPGRKKHWEKNGAYGGPGLLFFG